MAKLKYPPIYFLACFYASMVTPLVAALVDPATTSTLEVRCAGLAMSLSGAGGVWLTVTLFKDKPSNNRYDPNDPKSGRVDIGVLGKPPDSDSAASYQKGQK